MHPAVIICIILAIITTIFAITIGIKENEVEISIFLFFIITVVIVGGIGFGFICTVFSWNQTCEKISPDKIESSIFKNGGIVVSVYEGKLYQSTEIEDLNAVNNIDYYALIKYYNAYDIEISRILYPVEKGKIDDYIKEK